MSTECEPRRRKAYNEQFEGVQQVESYQSLISLIQKTPYGDILVDLTNALPGHVETYEEIQSRVWKNLEDMKIDTDHLRKIQVTDKDKYETVIRIFLNILRHECGRDFSVLTVRGNIARIDVHSQN